MTRHFEVIKRYGPARLGKLVFDETLNTPCLIPKERIVSAGPLWGFSSLEEALENADDLSETEKLFIGPHVSTSLHAEPPVTMPWHPREGSSGEKTPRYGPIGAVIHPLSEEKLPEADVYVLAAAGSLQNPRELVRVILKVKNEIPPDSALYVPALATPSNLALLVYMGVDLFDSTKVLVDGLMGRYHTRDGVFSPGDLSELPCLCPHCQALEADGAFEPQLQAQSRLYPLHQFQHQQQHQPLPEQQSPHRSRLQLQHVRDHNLLKLEEEIRFVRGAIKRGDLREYVEREVRVTPEQTTAFRLLDQEHRYIERQTPILRQAVMYSNTAESLQRVEVTRFAQRVLDRYRAPESDILLLLPCSARKPYSKSRSHQLFAMALSGNRRRVHELILTSPLALVPRELEDVYPAAHYDVPVTGRWDLEERDWITRCLEAYLEKNRYARIVAHLDGELKEMVVQAGIDAIYTNGGTNSEGLKDLAKTTTELVRDLDARRIPDQRILRFRAMADYYFGAGASELLLAGEVKVKGRELQAEKTLASFTPNGTLALTIEGGRRLEPLGAYQVHISDFVPKGDVLAPGVTRADEKIRPGDEVLVKGERVFGVGRARMSGWEMEKATRGVAVELRRVEKI